LRPPLLAAFLFGLEAARRVAFLLDLGGFVWKGEEEKKDATPPAEGSVEKA
jgi:hypothetical protein